MHELSIATAIVESTLHEARQRHLARVQTIAVRVGALSGVDPEALRFSFEAITADTPLAATKLEIEHVAVQGNCKACGHTFEVEDFFFVCPRCQSGQLEIMHGEELEIAYLEVDENAHETTEMEKHGM